MNKISKFFLFFFIFGAGLFYFLNQAKESNLASFGNFKSKDSQFLLELVGQLFIVGFEGKEPTPETLKFINELKPGGVLLLRRNIENKEQVKRLIEALQRESIKATGLPLLIAVDQEGGQVCRLFFLDCTQLSHIKTQPSAFELGKKRGQELSKLGINLNLAPVLDQAFETDFIYPRTFKTSLEKVRSLALAFIKGQNSARVLSVVKHFPGYGRISFNPERDKLPILNSLPQTTQFALFEDLEIMPMMMLANVIYKEHNSKLPFSFTKDGVLMARKIIGKDGFLISDDLSSPVLKSSYGLENTIKNVYLAGVDILLVAGFDEPRDPALAILALKNMFKNGELSFSELAQRIEKIIKLKQKL